ncbi:myocardin related transcription factor Ab isoform X3 [Girardinichthys multiradiatus]|uniref:myocardin related transcription factor Ab isoform X3 n=1 Tax=Girardinichthys multiradiatus TaxID=208333 RepID=UPI001FAC20EB|nr:myocardin related transcription factor Ab isoform X3 [Girardinichthys multiradiatus]
MLDTNYCMSFKPSPLDSPPMADDMEKACLKIDQERLVYHSLKEVLQLKLQQRRTREELVSQGIMPPLKSPAAFHEQRRSLERARTEDYLKRKIRSRPERSELVRMHILEETSAEPSLQAKQLKLKRARLADDLNDKISHRPGPIELVHKNILSVSCPLQSSVLDSPKGAGGESSSLDEDSSDALSPDQLTNHDSPLSAVTQLSPSNVVSQNGDISPTQFLTQPPPPPPLPPPPLVSLSDSSPLPKITNGLALTSRPCSGHLKAKTCSDRPPQRPKKPKDNKPKVKKLKYHQYIPPDQKADKERPPEMDSSYAKLLHQQQLFLQLQILSQQQQHYNYHTILPAPPKPQADQAPTTSSSPSPSRTSLTTTTAAPLSQNPTARQSQAAAAGTKPATLPANLDEFKVAELKQELKLRGLTVSGTKNDLIERLRNYQEQNDNATALFKNAISQSVQQASTSVANTTTTSASNTTSPSDHHPAEGGCFKLALSSLAQAVPGRIMRFGSTSSSPPVSPTPSERSLAGLSPDEASCNGDMFGEMVTSPLTQLTLHPSPQHPSHIASLPQPFSVVKEEVQSSCSLSKSSPVLLQPKESLSAGAMDTSCMDKDQMLQEKDKQIEELTRMLRQKQRLVETLRSQLEQGKMAGGVVVKKEWTELSRTSSEVKLQTLIKASSIQPPMLPNGIVLTVKEEVEPEKGMEGVIKEAQAKKLTEPMQCSQETLLRLQQIHQLQLQQAEHQKQQLQPKQRQGQVKLQKDSEGKSNSQKQQQKKEAQMLLHQQQQLQQLIIQQTQQKQLQAQQRTVQQKLAQQKVVQQKQVKQTQGEVQTQQKNQVQLKQVQIQNQTLTGQKATISQSQQRKQQRAQQRLQQKQQMAAPSTQQVSPVIVNQQNGTPLHTQAIALDLKANGMPTLVTDSNGNHYLIALSSHARDKPNGVSSLAKINGRITLQRLQSSPSKLPNAVSQSKEQAVAESARQPNKKKAGLHLDTNGTPQPSLSHTAPPSLQPFFEDMSDTESQSNLMSSLKREEVCLPYDRHTLFTPPSPKPNTSLPPQRSKENGVNSQQMDDLFDILLKSGEIPGFKPNPDPSLAPLNSDPPSPCVPASPLHLSSPTPTEPLSSQLRAGEHCTGNGRLEDFLESTTGTPLLCMEPDGGLTLIDDLHSQMLSTQSILDHPPSPMDTSDLGFSPHSTGLDFGDPTLDSMDWLDISMGTGGGGNVENGGVRGSGAACERDGGTSLTPLAPHTPPSVFSADFLDSTDLQLHWESCL